MISMELASKSSICSFQFERTSKIQLTFFDRIEIRQGSLDEFGCKPHGEENAARQALEGILVGPVPILNWSARREFYYALLSQ